MTHDTIYEYKMLLYTFYYMYTFIYTVYKMNP